MDRAFFSALAWTVLSPSTLLIVPIRVEAGGVFTLQRLRAMVIYGAGPEVVGLALLPVALLLFHLFVMRGGRLLAALTVMSIGAVALTNTMALAALATGLLILALVHGGRGVRMLATISLPAYLLVCRWLPPSLIATIRANSVITESADYHWGNRTVVAAVCVTYFIAAIWWLSRRWQDSALRFAFLWSALLLPVVQLSESSGINLLPQAFRLHLALEMAVSLAVALALARLPGRARMIVACAFLAASGWLTVRGYRFATRLIQAIDIRQSADYRVANELARRFPGRRVMAAGAVSYVFNIVSDSPQFYGGHEQFNPNWMTRVALYQLHTGDGAGVKDGDICVLWLKAFGVHAINVTGAGSEEHYKPFRRNPKLFESLLPAEYSAGGDTIYRVPQRTAGLAHVVPETALVVTAPRDGLDVAAVRSYVEALDDESLPPAEYTQTSLETARIRASVGAGQVISVQTSFHSGWRASIAGKPQPIASDGLGMLVIRPQCQGECAIDLVFTGGLELALTSWISGLTALTLAMLFVSSLRRL